MTMNKVSKGIRRRGPSAPQMEKQNGDSTILKYNVIGPSTVTDTNGNAAQLRYYVPGSTTGLTSSPGPAIAGYYSTGKFMPGTRIRWEPSCSFTQTGRVFVAFTDNPDIARVAYTKYNAYQFGTPAEYFAFANEVKAMQNVISFPIWQETEIPFPTKLRYKSFAVNTQTDPSDASDLNRSYQTGMFVLIEGTGATPGSYGSFWFHDKLMVEGITSGNTADTGLVQSVKTLDEARDA